MQQAPPSSHSSHPTKRCDSFQDLESGRWYEVGGKAARDKVGQALRDTMKALKKSSTVEQSEDEDINPRSNKKILKKKKRPSAEQTEDDINPRSNKKIRGVVSERAIVLVDTPNNKDASGSSRNDCSSMQCKQPSTPIFESLVVVSSALEEIVKNDEGEEDDEEDPPTLCTKEQVPSSGMVTVSDSVKGNNSKNGSCLPVHTEAVPAFNTSTSVWSKNLSDITLQASSSVKHPHHQEESCQKNARINREDVFLDPFEEDLEPVPLGPSVVVLGSSALLVAPPGPPCPSIHEKLFLDCGFHPMVSRDEASILSCGDARAPSPFASFLAKRNACNEVVAIMNDSLRPSDFFSSLLGW